MLQLFVPDDDARSGTGTGGGDSRGSSTSAANESTVTSVTSSNNNNKDAGISSLRRSGGAAPNTLRSGAYSSYLGGDSLLLTDASRLNNTSSGAAAANSDANYQLLLTRYEREFKAIKEKQHDVRAQAYMEAEQRHIDERRRLHDDPASLWGGDVGLAMAKIVAYAQQKGDARLQDMMVQLEMEMHAQMLSVQEGIDELKGRYDVAQREIAEERSLIAGHHSQLPEEHARATRLGSLSSNAGSSSSTGGVKTPRGALPTASTFASVAVPPAAKLRNPATPSSPLSSQQQQQQQPPEFPLTKIPVPLTTTRMQHSLHAFPLLIAEALWRELKCETVNIYLRGRDNVSNLVYSVPSRAREVTSFVRLHRAVETAVFDHQVAVCAWDAAASVAASASASLRAAAAVGGDDPSLAASKNRKTSVQTTTSMASSSSFGGSPHQFQPQSYVVWPVVLAGERSSAEEHQHRRGGGGDQQQQHQFVPSAFQDRVPTSGKKQPSAFADGLTAEQKKLGAHYHSVAAIECINKRLPTFATGGAVGINDILASEQQNAKAAAAAAAATTPAMEGSFNGAASAHSTMKNQFSKTDEALIASAARLLASCFEAYPEALVPRDEHRSHTMMQQQAAAIVANIRPLPGERPSVPIPSATAAADSACLAPAPVKVFRGPSAAIFKAAVGNSLANAKNVPSTPQGLVQARSAGAPGIDSFTHDGSLHSLEASISYLDSMWKAAFADNVGMHEECRKQQTKIRDLSFICSQVEECFAAARKLGTIEETRAFLRTAELSLKSGSRALLGSAMRLALDSELNEDDNRQQHSARGGATKSSGKSGGKAPPSSSAAASPSGKKPVLQPVPPSASAGSAPPPVVAVPDRLKKKDGIAISEIHIDGPEGLRHYTVDAATKKAQMAAIEESMKEAARQAEKERGAHHYRPPPPPPQQQQQQQQHHQQHPAPPSLTGGHRWLRHHQQQ